MIKHYYFLYFFFTNKFIRWLRVGLFFCIGIIVYLNLNNSALVISLLPVYFLLILQELYIHFKLEEGLPISTVKNNSRSIMESVDFRARALLENNDDLQEIISDLCHQNDIKYFNSLLSIPKDVGNILIDEEVLLSNAKDLVESTGGLYIHGLDIYASYLLLSDVSSKILFNNDIEKEDILAVISWIRKEFNLDKKKNAGLHFSGGGAFDFFVYGWSAELEKYASNFTSEVLFGKKARPVGRDREYDLLVTALSKNSSSNALLVGGAGVGKTTLVSQLVIDSDESFLPKSISQKIVFKLHPDRLLSGVDNTGDLEERFVALFSELSHAGNIIVYIPNIENIFGGGGLDVDISGTLVDYLKGNRIKIIGSTTHEAFQKHIYAKQEIKELFDIIEVNEPEEDAVVFMVLEKAKEIERINKIIISYSAVKKSCTLADSYMNDGTAMPGKAIRLLDDAVSYAMTHGIKKITGEEIRAFIQTKTNIVLDKPTEEESQKLLNLEQDIHKRIISQDEAVVAIADAMRRVRAGMKNEKKPIASFLFLGPTGVGKTETAKALAKSYFGDEKAMIRLDMSEYQNEDSVKSFLGDDSHYSETIVDKVLKSPFSLILLDEFEKAFPRILDLFLQVLDEGRLTDNLGRTVSFTNTIIIATSNAGSEFIREKYKEGVMNEEVKKQLVEKVLETNIFKPELVNRFDDVIVFKPLSENDAVRVSKLFIKEVIDRVAQKHVILTYEDGVAEFVAKSSYSVEFGARNISRFIEQSIENQLSKLILSNDLENGGTARIIIENNSLVIKV